LPKHLAKYDTKMAAINGKLVESMEESELKHELQERKLSDSGNQSDLVARLEAWVITEEKDKLSAKMQGKSKVPCSKLCKPGDGSICPNYLYGTLTRTNNGWKILSCLEVERMLRQMGVDPEKCSRCIMIEIQWGTIEVTGQPEELDKVIFMGRGKCRDCKIGPVKLGDALLQADNVRVDFENVKGEVMESFCHLCRECDGEYIHFHFVTPICRKHCAECPGYGQCIMDYKETHCPHCGGHGRRGWCYTEGCPNEFMYLYEESDYEDDLLHMLMSEVFQCRAQAETTN